ncbi:MAG: flippase-like domain-containing protein [Thermomicrobiaceae bacterium]|nr:flippase-like domain-containing protein [Thermomicrobiaceae bacterium]
MKRLLVICLIVASATALVVLTNLRSLPLVLLSLPSGTLATLGLLLLANEITKGLRWTFFLRSAQLDIRTVDGLTSYLAAQSATALPGGSMLSARLAEEHGGVRMYQAAAGLVGQTIADVLAVGLMASAAILLTEQPSFQLLIPAGALAAAGGAIAVIRSRSLAQMVTALLARWRLTRRFLSEEEDFREHSVALMRPAVLAVGVTFSVLTTLISAIVLATFADALTARGVSPGEALYVHAFSTVARLVVPIPGDWGITAGSLAGMLNFIGIGLARATFIAIGYRSVGLLFRTFLGIVVLLARYPALLIGPSRVPQWHPARRAAGVALADPLPSPAPALVPVEPVEPSAPPPGAAQ